MTWVALVGSECEGDLPLRSLAGSLARAGYRSAIVVPVESGLAAILEAPERPAVVALSLGSQPQAQRALPFALALRQRGYVGHLTAGGRIATSRGAELLRDCAGLDSILRHDAEDGCIALVSALAGGLPLRGIPGLAFRSDGHVVGERDPDAVALEMVELQRTRGVEIFVFRDDGFLPNSPRKNLERVHALADALERRGTGRFATVIRARATEVDRALLQVLRDRLQVIRVDLDVEHDPRRWSSARRNQRAIDSLRELDLYGCLNIHASEPDITFESLATRLEFMRQACDFPFRVGRIAACAPDVERVFRLAGAVFRERDRLVGRLMATRFDMEVCRHFDPARHERSWRAEAIALTRALGEDSVRALRCIVEHVEHSPAGAYDARLVRSLARGLREVEARIGVALSSLARAGAK